jgi:hypothetical protein
LWPKIHQHNINWVAAKFSSNYIKCLCHLFGVNYVNDGHAVDVLKNAGLNRYLGNTRNLSYRILSPFYWKEQRA